MGFFEVLLTIAVAVIFGILFFYIFRYTGPWGRLWTFIVILVLVALATAAWIEPVGPVYWDIAWLPVIFVILLFALFLAAATPLARSDRRNAESRKPPAEREETAIEREEIPQIALGAFFWLFLVLLVFIAVWGIIR